MNNDDIDKLSIAWAHLFRDSFKTKPTDKMVEVLARSDLDIKDDRGSIDLIMTPRELKGAVSYHMRNLNKELWSDDPWLFLQHITSAHIVNQGLRSDVFPITNVRLEINKKEDWSFVAEAKEMLDERGDK